MTYWERFRQLDGIGIYLPVLEILYDIFECVGADSVKLDGVKLKVFHELRMKTEEGVIEKVGYVVGGDE